jgi:hypothetical protein
MSQLPNNSSSFSASLPTPNSFGQTYHKHNFETDGLTNHLNINNDASGNWTGDIGGFNFSTINSTLTAPISLATIDISGITITTDSIGPPSLLALPNVQNSIDIAVILSAPVDVAPYNMGPVNTIWEVQVNSNCTNMVTGVTYYAKYFNSTTLQLNTSPDGGVSTIIDTADLASRTQPILSLVNAGPPIVSTSLLSSTDLTFDNVSLQTTLNNLTIKQTTVSNQGLSLAIFADGRPALAPTATFSQQYAFSPSWYFKNIFASNNKINWYFAGSLGMTVSQVLGLYMNIFNGLTTSNDNSPFLVIYTQPQAGDPNFYRSKRVYIFDQSIQPTVNTRYFMFANVSETCPTPYTPFVSTLINMELSTVAGSNVGPFASNELILAFTISTNSASVINSVEFAVNKFGVITPTGTQEILLLPT